MLKHLTPVLFLFLCLTASAQDTTCDCTANLKETITKTEINYAGFPGKVNPKTRKAYDLMVSTLTIKAAGEKNTKACFYLIKDYIRFFKDKHFSLSYLNNDDPDREILDAAALQEALRTGKHDPVEGTWTSPDSSLSLLIKKFPGPEFKAVVLEAKDEKLSKGLVYFTLRPHQKGFLLNQYHVFNSVDFYAQQRGGLLQLWNFALFGKVSGNGMTAAERQELSTWKNNNNGLDFKQLDEETSYIRIPTFFNNDSKIEKLVAASDQRIRNSKYLIIDLRGNGGGNTGWSFLLPYVMTGPIKQDSPWLRVSEDNNKLKRAELEYFAKNPVPKEMQKYYPDAYVAQLKKIYEELPLTKKQFYQVPGLVIPLDSLLAKPAKVALITDGLCGSSTEYFFHLMAQSSKVTRYGQNSVGMMDYEGPAVTTPLPSKQLMLMMPVSKMSWADQNPIDEKGFSPDVKLSIPGKAWLDLIREDLKK